MGTVVAEMVLADPDGFVRYRLDSDGGIIRSSGSSMGALAALADEAGGGVLAARTERQPAIRAGLAELGLRDALAAPLSGVEDPRGVLIVGDRNGPVGFDAEDLRLFEVLASHSAVALRGGLLLDRLKEEVAAREYEALHDALTGLANRTLFVRALESALANRAVGQPVPVMLMDLDGFKEINDTMGHHTGDAVLSQIGGRLSALMAHEGTVARLGGDEFAFVVPDLASPARVAELAQAIQAEVVRPVEVDGLVLGLRASLGVSMAPDHGEEPSILMRRADVAMYAAKSAGGGMAVYDWSTDHHSTRRLMLATELRAAGQIDQIDVWFQPQAELATGVVVGCEALARWTHPLHGVIPPEEFIPVAEQSGSLGPLTWRMLDVALRQCSEWHDHGLAINVSVNISVHTLLEAGLVDRLARLLSDIGIDPRWLTLELTESSIMGDPVQSGGVLSLLGQLGVSLAIDDFGTGHSSLTRLKRLPIHIVKIDKSFVTSMTADQGDAAIVRSTVELARSLGHIVVAEGVEDQVTWDRLAALGCDRAQGYHLARPMPGAAVESWLRRRSRARTPLSVVRAADHLRGA
jgi:diguanylate cyclase (GGDEF)-like protein